MNYEVLFWDTATALAPALVVFLLLTLVLDWLRTILFPIGR